MSTDTPSNVDSETFAEFQKSFSYGSRTDLSFKFLANLSEEAAATFIQQLLAKVGETFDDGNVDRLIEHVVEGQTAAYSSPAAFTYEEGPFTQPAKPVGEMRIGLLTSTGHFLADEDPEPLGVTNMSQEEATERIQDFLKAAPDLSEIPLDAPPDQLRARHGGYDIRGVQADRNVALPLDRMQELERDGVIGSAVTPAYSFVGAAAQMRILSKTGPAWVETFQQANIEGMLLVPV